MRDVLADMPHVVIDCLLAMYMGYESRTDDEDVSDRATVFLSAIATAQAMIISSRVVNKLEAVELLKQRLDGEVFRYSVKIDQSRDRPSRCE